MNKTIGFRLDESIRHVINGVCRDAEYNVLREVVRGRRK